MNKTMRKYKDKRFYAIIICSILMILMMIASLITFNLPAFAEKNEKELFESEYEYDQILQIPNHEIEVDGTKYNADCVVNYPDGTATSLKKIRLNKLGKYVVDYRLNLNGKNYSEKFSFVVPYPTYSFNQKTDKAEYKVVNGVEGLYVNLNQGGSITFNHSINRKLLTKANDLLSFYVLPYKVGDIEAKDIYLDIIDSADEDNMVTIRFNQSPDAFGSNINFDVIYMKAKASDQEFFYGYERGFEDGRIIGNNYGFAAHASFFGLHFGEKKFMATVSYDDETKTVYSPNNYYAKHGDCVMCINEERVNADKIWGGFKGDYVKLRLRADEFTKSNMTFVITKLLGTKLNQYKLNINTASDINIISDYEDGEYPKAIVGKPYKIFDATSAEVYTNEKMSINVFTAYGSSARHNISIDDGYFIPNKEGTYTIEYKIIDGFGNVNKKTIDIEAVKSVDPIDCIVNGHLEEAVLGSIYKLGQLENISGGTGKYTIKKFMVEKGTELKTEIEDEIRLTKEGEFEIIYDVTDYVGNNKIITKSLKVLPADKPIIVEDVVIPKAFVVGGTYTLPNLTAEDYSKGTIENIDCEISILEGTDEIKYNGKYVPEKAGDIIINYSAKDSKGRVSTKSYKSKTIDVGFPSNIDITKYFESNGGTIVATKNTVELSGENVEFNFLREILGNIETEFNMDSQVNASKGICVTIVDYFNPSSSINIKFVKNGELTDIIINDDVSNVLNQPLGGIKNFTVDIKGRDISILEKKFYITKDAKGNDYNGYEKAYISFSFIECTGESKIILKQINRQPMNKRKIDISEPILKVLGTEIKEGNINDIVTTAPAMSMDVLDPMTITTITVIKPDSTICKDVNGIEINKLPASKSYNFKLDQFGVYIISYEYKDSSDNSRSYNYAVSCMDKVKPEIEIKEDKLTAKVGEELVVPDYIVKDNTSSKENTIVNIMIITPEETIHILTDKGYKFERAGTYKLRVMAIDEYNNMTIKDVCIEVK